MLDNYIEETKPLFKLLKTEAFNFVIVRYNHIKYVRQIQNDLMEKFPDRPAKTLNCSELTYEKLMSEYFSLEKGFLFLEDFGALFNDEKLTPGVVWSDSITNEGRKSSLLEGLNRRRDKLAQYPIALFIFVPAIFGTLYARKIMERIPDLWSFRSLILDIKGGLDKLRELSTVVEPTEEEIADLENKKKEKQKELNRLLTQLNKTADDEIQYKLTLYPQIVEIQRFLEKYEDALLTYEEWESLVGNGLDIEDFLNNKADILFNLGRFDELKAELSSIIRIIENNIESLQLPDSFRKKNLSQITKDELFDYNIFDLVNNSLLLLKCFRIIQVVEFQKNNFESSIKFSEKCIDFLTCYPIVFDKDDIYDLYFNNYYQIALNYQKLNNKELVITNLKKSTEYLEKLIENNVDNEQYQVELEYIYDVIKKLTSDS